MLPAETNLTLSLFSASYNARPFGLYLSQLFNEQLRLTEEKAYDIKVILRGLHKNLYNFVNIAALNFDSTDNPVVREEDKRSLYLSCVRGWDTILFYRYPLTPTILSSH